jgi:hypothetical protein
MLYFKEIKTFLLEESIFEEIIDFYQKNNLDIDKNIYDLLIDVINKNNSEKFNILIDDLIKKNYNRLY